MHSDKNAQIPNRVDQALQSTVKHNVSNDEIILKKKSDLGNGSYPVTGANTDGVPHANTDGVPQGNTDGAEKSGESTDSDGTFDWDDFNPDAGAIPLDLSKVGNILGSSKQT